MVCTTSHAISLCITVIHIAGGDRGHCSLIFIHRDGSGDSSTITDDHWRFIYIVDRYCQRLHIGKSVAVSDRDFYLVSALSFMIWRSNKRQFTGARIDTECSLVCSTGQTISLCITVIHVAGGNCSDSRLVFIHRHSANLTTPITGDHWRFVHVIDRHGQRLNIGQPIAVSDRDFNVVDILDFMIWRCDKRQLTGARVDAECSLVCTTSHAISLCITVIHVAGRNCSDSRLVFIHRHSANLTTPITGDHRCFVHVIDRHGQRLNIGQPIAVSDRDFNVVDILDFMVWRSYKRQFARA